MAQERKRVVWFEGMTLDPQHFQQWNRHWTDVLDTRVRAVEPEGWGLMRCEIDEERLANGQFVLRECAGVMPDGLAFEVPASSPVPDARNLQEHMPATEETLQVLLAVPAHRTKGRNVQLQRSSESRETRFVAESAQFPDENTGDNQRPVEVARPNVQVRFASEPQQGYNTLPIAEVERTAGGFALRDGFVPPCLSIGASSQLQELARQMLELLVAKSADMRTYQEEAFAQRKLSPSDILSLNLLGTLNAYIPQLKTCTAHEERHPRELLDTLTALAGELSTYIEEAPVEPRELPTYTHSAPSEAFRRIDVILRRMLGDATPSADYERVDLQHERENLYVGAVEQSLVEDAQLFLATRSTQHSEQQLMNALPDMLRIASPDTIDDVLQSYTQALNVKATRRLPANMPIDNQATYFKMEKRGPFWEAICDEEGIAIFIPSDFQDVGVELIAAR